jgi:hypothetical protein
VVWGWWVEQDLRCVRWPPQVMQLLKVWEDWSIYPPLYLTGLEAVFRMRAGDLEDDEPIDEAVVEKEKDQLIRQVRGPGPGVCVQV